MANGGSDNCGGCCFFSGNLEKAVSDRSEDLRLPHCVLRRIIMRKSPFWTYCGNHSPIFPPQITEPSGDVYVDGGSYPYSRKVWITEEDQTILLQEQQKLAEFCRQNLDLKNPQLGDEYGYSNLPLCVVDAVFSIGAHYKSTQNVVKRLRAEFRNKQRSVGTGGATQTEEEEFTISNLIHLYEAYGLQRMVDEVYQNRQRTSTTNGILKAEAVLEFSRVLLNFGVERRQDVERIMGDPEFEGQIKRILGQTSGISLIYFYILAGAQDYVKPDRMIQRLLSTVLGREVKTNECHGLIFGAALILEQDYPSLRAYILDHLMWKYQSGR